MLSPELAISRVRRGITYGVVLKALLLAMVFGCVLFVPASVRFLALTGVVGVWIALSVQSARGSRLASDSPSLIAAGQYDEAEQHIDQAMRAFSLFSGTKLQALHQLAVLRHAQRRWQESAALSRALIGRRLGGHQQISKASRLMLAESLLEMGDVNGGFAAVYGLYGEQLTLAESLNLLSLQLDYEAKIEAWPKMFADAPAKVQMAELMPARQAARAQALLALAALRVGRPDWSDWLRRRAEVLADVNQLAAERPALWALWKKGE